MLRLLERGDTVVGIDNHNSHHDPALKEARLARHADRPQYIHLRIDLADHAAMDACFKTHQPERVVNLAAQAGVRYSIENPLAHIDGHLYQLPTTGLRFFTVYGPWGWPNMALFKFTAALLAGKPSRPPPWPPVLRSFLAWYRDCYKA